MDTQAMETIKTLEIKSAPEKQTLEAANESYTKKQLAHFIERHDLAIAKSWLKDDIVSALSEWMNNAQKDVLANDSDLLAFYEKMLASDEKLNLYGDNISEDEGNTLLSLMEYGLLYNVDGTVWAPAEAAETTEDVDVEVKTVSEEKRTAKQKTITKHSKQTKTSDLFSFNRRKTRTRKTSTTKVLKKTSKEEKRQEKKIIIHKARADSVEISTCFCGFKDFSTNRMISIKIEFFYLSHLIY